MDSLPSIQSAKLACQLRKNRFQSGNDDFYGDGGKHHAHDAVEDGQPCRAQFFADSPGDDEDGVANQADEEACGKDQSNIAVIFGG